MQRPEPDPAVVAAVSAQATAQHAHHQAGHAVAAVFCGGELINVFLGTADFSTLDDSADTSGGTEHRTEFIRTAFVTFAGPWAEAKWTCQNEPGTDLEGALDCAWMENADGDTAKYERFVEGLSTVAAELGFDPVGRGWESAWINEELEPLWPGVCEVAALLISGQPVTHEVVRSLLGNLTEDDG